MLGKKSPEVLVVGAGPVGLMAALVLAKREIRVEIVDKEWRTGGRSYALALHGRSLQLFEELGLLERILAQAYPVNRIGLYDRASQRAEMRLPAGKEDRRFLAIMAQDALEHWLEESLRDLDVPVLWNHEVVSLSQAKFGVDVKTNQLVKEPTGYAVAHTEWVVARTLEDRVRLVIGADGHQSAVRRSLGIDFAEAGEAEHFAVFEFETDFDFQGQMWIVLSDGTTDVVWPLPGRRCRWSFQLVDLPGSLPGRKKERIAGGGSSLPVATEESLRALLRERAPWFEGRIGPISWRTAVRFDRRLANEFGRHRVWLAGDAAHLTGPVGMQGMNVGLREAADLAQIMANILLGKESMEQLACYGRDRESEWRYLLGFEGGLKPAIAANPWMRQHCDQLLPCIPASGPELAELVKQIGLQA